MGVAMMGLLVLASQPGPLLDGHVRGGGSAAVVPRRCPLTHDHAKIPCCTSMSWSVCVNRGILRGRVPARRLLPAYRHALPDPEEGCTRARSRSRRRLHARALARAYAQHTHWPRSVLSRARPVGFAVGCSLALASQPRLAWASAGCTRARRWQRCCTAPPAMSADSSRATPAPRTHAACA